MITVKNLQYTYPGNQEPTLKGLDFEIQEGEVFGFLGPSGSGKSTAQKVVYKILTDYKGEVSINGKMLHQWDQAYFENIGVGFELPNHYLKLSGKENLQLFRSFYPNNEHIPMEELFDMVDMQAAMDQQVSAYSKGMKMRLNFIRAIQHQPDILFFDEPTSGLDPVNARKIKEHILELKRQGKTIFVTTHSMETADFICDRVAFIVEGEIVTIDTPAQLKKQYGKEAVVVETVDGKQEEFALAQIGQNQAFLDFIKNTEVKSMYTLDASLEEVFIKVTGKSLIA